MASPASMPGNHTSRMACACCAAEVSTSGRPEKTSSTMGLPTAAILSSKLQLVAGQIEFCARACFPAHRAGFAEREHDHVGLAGDLFRRGKTGIGVRENLRALRVQDRTSRSGRMRFEGGSAR